MCYHQRAAILLIMVALMPVLAACDNAPPAPVTATSATVTPAQAAARSTEQPVAPETNPPGDIPDTQAFVKYASAVGGYELDVPEGWARTESGPNVSFVDKFDGAKIVVTDAPD
ncbi:MAG: hypothetical protein QOH93_2103, partial [Chloroflexia bacterium]|nr:hypothetical protein [Chloroflexia bacterium]